MKFLRSKMHSSKRWDYFVQLARWHYSDLNLTLFSNFCLLLRSLQQWYNIWWLLNGPATIHASFKKHQIGDTTSIHNFSSLGSMHIFLQYYNRVHDNDWQAEFISSNTQQFQALPLQMYHLSWLIFEHPPKLCNTALASCNRQNGCRIMQDSLVVNLTQQKNVFIRHSSTRGEDFHTMGNMTIK